MQLNQLNVVDYIDLIKVMTSNVEEEDYGEGRLHWAAYDGDIDLMEEILEKAEKNGKKREDVLNQKDEHGMTPLFWAIGTSIYAEDLGMIEFLLQNGADANAQNEDGMAPLHWAAFQGVTETVKVLLQNNAKSTKDFFERTPEKFALKKGYFQIIRLLRAGAQREEATVA